MKQSLYEILQVLSLNLFEKSIVAELFAEATVPDQTRDSSKQLLLFDF